MARMKKKTGIKKKVMQVLWLLAAVFLLAGCTAEHVPAERSVEQTTQQQTMQQQTTQQQTVRSQEQPVRQETVEAAGIVEDGVYDTKEEVALYLHLYGRLPDNYITKKEAENLGWDSKKGNLWEVAPGMSIGGSRFGNYEGQLPEEKGRSYYECDLEYDGGYRGAKRLVYSDDGLIFYTEDHYKTFEQLYGE